MVDQQFKKNLLKMRDYLVEDHLKSEAKYREKTRRLFDPNGGNDLSGNVIAKKWYTISSVGISLGMGLTFVILSTNLFYLKDYSDPEYRILVMFLCSFPIIALGCLYYSLCHMLNQTTFAVEPERLSIENGPVPWLKSKRSYNKNSISRFYIRELPYNSMTPFALYVRMVNGTDEIIETFEQFEEAKILEKWLVARFNILSDSEVS